MKALQFRMIISIHKRRHNVGTSSERMEICAEIDSFSKNRVPSVKRWDFRNRSFDRKRRRTGVRQARKRSFWPNRVPSVKALQFRMIISIHKRRRTRVRWASKWRFAPKLTAFQRIEYRLWNGDIFGTEALIVSEGVQEYVKRGSEASDRKDYRFP